QQSFPITEARVITQAAELSSPKTAPKSSLVLLAGIVGGCIFAGLVAIFLEMVDRVFRTVQQVERLLQTNCLASVPIVSFGADEAAKSSLSRLKGWLPFPSGWRPNSQPDSRSTVTAGQMSRATEAGPGHLTRSGERQLTIDNSIGRF